MVLDGQELEDMFQQVHPNVIQLVSFPYVSKKKKKTLLPNFYFIELFH